MEYRVKGKDGRTKESQLRYAAKRFGKPFVLPVPCPNLNTHDNKLYGKFFDLLTFTSPICNMLQAINLYSSSVSPISRLHVITYLNLFNAYEGLNNG